MFYKINTIISITVLFSADVRRFDSAGSDYRGGGGDPLPPHRHPHHRRRSPETNSSRGKRQKGNAVPNGPIRVQRQERS